MDYSKIEADIVRGPEIGRMYVEASSFITIGAQLAYREMAGQVVDQYREMVELDRIKVSFVEDNPYEDASELFADIRKGSFAVYATSEDQRHPLLGRHTNDMFRAVHDFYGHWGTRRGFDRHGEEAAWVRHSQLFTGLGRRAMTTETRGQNSAFIWINGGREFPPQKAVLLPDWVSRIPERWS